MDGSFDVTVEKLIRHWCPTLEEKDLKWVHQLDFGERSGPPQSCTPIQHVMCGDKEV